MRTWHGEVQKIKETSYVKDLKKKERESWAQFWWIKLKPDWILKGMIKPRLCGHTSLYNFFSSCFCTDMSQWIFRFFLWKRILVPHLWGLVSKRVTELVCLTFTCFMVILLFNEWAWSAVKWQSWRYLYWIYHQQLCLYSDTIEIKKLY